MIALIYSSTFSRPRRRPLTKSPGYYFIKHVVLPLILGAFLSRLIGDKSLEDGANLYLPQFFLCISTTRTLGEEADLLAVYPRHRIVPGVFPRGRKDERLQTKWKISTPFATQTIRAR